MKKIYVAGPLFTEGERWLLEKIDKTIRHLGFDTYLPHRDAGLKSEGKETDYYFQRDKKEIEESAYIVAVLNGQDVDSGTAWEIGYAYALQKPIYAFTDDMRIAQSSMNINPMIAHSTQISFSLEDLVTKLKKVINHREG